MQSFSLFHTLSKTQKFQRKTLWTKLKKQNLCTIPRWWTEANKILKTTDTDTQTFKTTKWT